MSATSAGEAAPNTAEIAINDADAAQIAPDVAVVNDAAPHVADAEQRTPKEDVTSAGVVDAEEAEHRHKALTVARIRLSKAPAAVKERFVELAEAANNAATVEACLKAVEESLPEFLRESRAEVARGEHPAGEVFFRGNAEEITEEQAEEVARKQLERSGLLRGQRVRVAD